MVFVCVHPCLFHRAPLGVGGPSPFRSSMVLDFFYFFGKVKKQGKVKSLKMVSKRKSMRPAAAGRRVKYRTASYVPASAAPRYVLVKPGEKKYFDTTQSAVAVGTGGTTFSNSSLVLIPTGTGQSNMIGRKITVSSIHVRGTFRITKSLTAAAGDSVRFLLCLRKPGGTGSGGISEILENPDFWSFRDMDEASNHLVLAEVMMDLQQDSGAINTISGCVKHFKINKNVNIQVDYEPEATPGTRLLSEIKHNNIYLLGITAYGRIECEYTARVRFTDS